ncbi:uncharacterized protein LOC103853448 [Brassica rapa]|uniref:uncharacterized protein LOC103853448 n=1 Tax=Brassica campestris TaxID=3711 RepID=UPI00142E3B8E|nr:uncharacterized protein LOC103853448 [Brassica rapa]
MSAEMDRALLALSLKDDDDGPFTLPNLPQYFATERNEILEKGMQTFDDWGLAMDRWVEKPQPGFLQSVSVWVRISNIPVNHYTKEAISELGDLIGHVEKRLTHAKERCPFLEHAQGSSDQSKGFMSISQTSLPQRVLEATDPLYGILKEDQVGINPLSGRPRIAPEILQEMRNYLLASSSEDRHVREQRVIASVKDAEMKLDSQRSVMQLIPTSLFTSVINKGKEIVVSDDNEGKMGHSSIPNPQPKLMAAAISSGQTMFNTTTNVFCKLSLPSLQQSQVNPTSSLITFTAEPSNSKEKAIRKPGRFKRIYNSRKKSQKLPQAHDHKEVTEGNVSKKRKAEDDLAGVSKAAKSNTPQMVPREGPSNA